MLPEDKMSQSGQYVNGEAKCYQMTGCHSAENMSHGSHIDELLHTEQTSSPHASDHHMLTPPKPPIHNDVPQYSLDRWVNCDATLKNRQNFTGWSKYYRGENVTEWVKCLK